MSGIVFFRETAAAMNCTLSLHDALPIYEEAVKRIDAELADIETVERVAVTFVSGQKGGEPSAKGDGRSEEHTSELQSHVNLVCRLLLEKKKKPVDARY